MASSNSSSGDGSGLPPNDDSSKSYGGRDEKKRPALLISPPASARGEHHSSDATAKRLAVNIAGTAAASSAEPPSSSPSLPLVDVCNSVGINPGDRVEVMWDIHFEEQGEHLAGEDEGRDVPSEDATGKASRKAGDAEDSVSSRKIMRWWGATLLMHDGRAHTLSDEDGAEGNEPVSAALRVLDYDPYPEGGFHDRSLEEVVFLSDKSVLNVSSGTRAHWRKEGDSWEPGPDDEIDEDGVNAAVAIDDGGEQVDNLDAIPLPDPAENLRTILDNVLHKALEKTSGAAKMKSMSAAQRAVIAEKIARTKETLLEKMMALPEGENGGVITADHVQRCMAEMGQET